MGYASKWEHEFEAVSSRSRRTKSIIPTTIQRRLPRNVTSAARLAISVYRFTGKLNKFKRRPPLLVHGRLVTRGNVLGSMRGRESRQSKSECLTFVAKNERQRRRIDALPVMSDSEYSFLIDPREQW